MRPASLLFLPALLAATFNATARAQVHASSGGCPVPVSVRPNLNGGRMLRSSSETADHTVSVTIGGVGDSAVKAADVTVHGLQMSNGFLPTYRGPREVSIKFHMVQPEDAAGPLTAELKLPASMASVQSATVEAVTYRNGETWKASDGASCISVPDRVMPVASLR